MAVKSGGLNKDGTMAFSLTLHSNIINVGVVKTFYFTIQKLKNVFLKKVLWNYLNDCLNKFCYY